MSARLAVRRIRLRRVTMPIHCRAVYAWPDRREYLAIYAETDCATLDGERATAEANGTLGFELAVNQRESELRDERRVPDPDELRRLW